jgi:D-apiose dehydrogenase
MKKLKVALAGAGMVSRHHLIAWSKCADAEMVAIADPVLERAKVRADEFGVPQVFDSMEAMLAAGGIEALDVATPLDTHAAAVAVAVERGIAVLCQKPLAATVQEAQAIADHAAPRARLMVHENWRFRPQYRLARKWLDEGRIGAIRRFEIAALSSGLVPRGDDPPPSLQRQPFLATMDRLIILELLIHHLDTARFLLGEMEVQSSLTLHSSDVAGEDAAIIGLCAASGAVGTVTGDFRVPGLGSAVEDRLDIIGTTGRMSFDGETLALFGTEERLESHHFDPADAYQAAYDNAIGHFVERLRSKMPFETAPGDNLRSLALVEAAYQVARPPARAGLSPSE